MQQQKSTRTYTCKTCKVDFLGRKSDRARGWAIYCSTSCKARMQEARTGQHALNKSLVDSGGAGFANAHQFDNTEL